jgi:hypothetical protein
LPPLAQQYHNNAENIVIYELQYYLHEQEWLCVLFKHYCGFIDINNILFRMNAEKLKILQASVRTGGKGSVRRKKKVIITD